MRLACVLLIISLSALPVSARDLMEADPNSGEIVVVQQHERENSSAHNLNETDGYREKSQADTVHPRHHGRKTRQPKNHHNL